MIKMLSSAQDAVSVFLRSLRRWIDPRAFSFLSSERIAIGLIIFGIFFRLKHYLTNCSLWTDEAWVAVSLSSRSFMNILKGIEIFPDFSKPPLGFLLLAKSSIMVLGNHEYALRLWSFIFGVGSLILFYRLVNKVKDKALTLITLGFFAFCPSLIYYSAELKQYSLDLFFGLWLCLVFSNEISGEVKLRKAIGLGLLGALAIWMSNAILFLLAAFAMTLFIFIVREKRWKDLLHLGLIYVFWAISFWFLYKKYLSNMVTNDALFQGWQGAVLDVPIFSMKALGWIATVFLQMFSDPLSFSFAGLALVFFFVGFYSLLKKKKEYALMFFSAVMITLMAALAHKYPFRGRLLLFLLPGVLILVVEGLLTVVRKIRQPFSLGFVIVFCLLLGAGPFTRAFQGFTKDYCREETRQAITFVQKHFQRGDFILLNSAAQFPLWYYGGQLKLAKDFEQSLAGVEDGVVKTGVKIAKFWQGSRVVNGKRFILFRYEFNLYDKNYMYVKSLIRSEVTEKDIYLLFKDLPFAYPIEGNRLWMILADPDKEFEEIAAGSLGLRFPRLDEFKGKGASVYLYQLK